uniref:Uncharacterized protein n=1 Tax=Arundo donax TaxID=35708 RepID=A0A0A8Y9M5_ARUDO
MVLFYPYMLKDLLMMLACLCLLPYSQFSSFSACYPFKIR